MPDKLPYPALCHMPCRALLNDCCKTDLGLVHHPHIVAIGCIHLVSSRGRGCLHVGELHTAASESVGLSKLDAELINVQSSSAGVVNQT